MGTILALLHGRSSMTSDLAVEHEPIMYGRKDDYTPAGLPRKNVQETWDIALKSMITVDLPTRRLLYPIIQNRIKLLEASQKYNTCKLGHILQQYPLWEEQNVFDVHDLFQVFEVDGDGLIEVNEMCVGLDNLGDTTPTEKRIDELLSSDDDGTGSFDFEEFLSLIYNLDVTKGGFHPLAVSFRNADRNVRFIRHMSTVQQIRAGFM